MSLSRILKCQQSQIMPYSRELTYWNDWSTQPSRLYSIDSFNVSKTTNIFLEPSADGENWLYEFEDAYSVDQTFHERRVLRKRKGVQDCVVMSREVPTKLWEITHKLELKELQAIQSSKALRAPNSIRYHSNGAFGMEVSMHTSGPELMVVYMVSRLRPLALRGRTSG